MDIIKSINNENNPKRNISDISSIILHHTGSKASDESNKNFLNRTDYISAHYIVGQEGEIWHIMDNDRIAYHAGVSSYKGLKTVGNSLNWCTLGIEVNSDGKNFTDAQRKSTKELIEFLAKEYNIERKYILRHKDIAPGRKWDIGENFHKPLSWNAYVASLDLEKSKLPKDIKFKDMDTIIIEAIQKDYQPMSIEDMRKQASEWQALEDFERGIKLLTKPQNYKDFRMCIILGRVNGK